MQQSLGNSSRFLTYLAIYGKVSNFPKETNYRNNKKVKKKK